MRAVTMSVAAPVVADIVVAVVHYIIRIMQLAQEQVVVDLRQKVAVGLLGNNRVVIRGARRYEIQTKSD